MRGLRPWWKTHPEHLWTSEDRAAALRAGWRPKVSEHLPQRSLADPPLQQSAVLLPEGFGGLYCGDPVREARRRSQRADAALAKVGLRPRT